MKLLLIEDEPALHLLIRKALEKEGYVVESAKTFTEAMDKVDIYRYDCILLDIMLPDGSGLDVLKHLKKQRREESVLILSARDSIEDKVEGLELGADDYLAKPFHNAELIARVRSIIRRKQNKGHLIITLGNVRINPDEQSVEVEHAPLELSRKEFDILLYFCNRPNRLIDKSLLAEAVWGDNADQADNFDFIYAQVKNLRKKLKEAHSTIEIKSVYGFGYKLIEIES